MVGGVSQTNPPPQRPDNTSAAHAKERKAEPQVPGWWAWILGAIVVAFAVANVVARILSGPLQIIFIVSLVVYFVATRVICRHASILIRRQESETEHL